MAVGTGYSSIRRTVIFISGNWGIKATAIAVINGVYSYRVRGFPAKSQGFSTRGRVKDIKMKLF